MTFKIAVFTDAHANLPALEVALDAIAAEGCDAIYHTGDAIGYGPYPAKVLDRLLHTPKMLLLMGNHDELFVFGVPYPLPLSMSEGEAAHQHWVHAQLDPSLRAVVAGWPYLIEDSWHGRSLAFTHYARDADDIGFLFVVSSQVEDLDRLFANVNGSVIFHGHDHAPADRQGRARYINPGVLGGGDVPLARFVVVEIEKDGAYDLRQYAIPYDPADYFRQLVLRDVPEREFIAQVMFGVTLDPE
jgi:predicted phosphodiesterase